MTSIGLTVFILTRQIYYILVPNGFAYHQRHIQNKEIEMIPVFFTLWNTPSGINTTLIRTNVKSLFS